jgi:hypothetical protein
MLKMAHSISLVERSSLLPYKAKKNKFAQNKRIIFFKFPFDLNLSNINVPFRTAFNAISSSKEIIGSNFKLIFNMQNNLASIFIHEFQLFSIRNFRYKKCLDKKCSVCFYANENAFIVVNNFYVPIMADSSCKSKDILYIITCIKCNQYYIGQSMSVGSRLKTHFKCIRLKRTTSNCVCVMEHFNSPGHHTLENFTFNIFNVDITDLFKRLSLETHLIHLFLKIGAILINDFIPSLFYWHNNVNLFLND